MQLPAVSFTVLCFALLTVHSVVWRSNMYHAEVAIWSSQLQSLVIPLSFIEQRQVTCTCFFLPSSMNRERKCAENYNKWRCNFFFKTALAFWSFQTITVSECCSIKLLLYILLEKYIYILALKMTNPVNHHCANCIGALLLIFMLVRGSDARYCMKVSTVLTNTAFRLIFCCS